MLVTATTYNCKLYLRIKYVKDIKWVPLYCKILLYSTNRKLHIECKTSKYDEKNVMNTHHEFIDVYANLNCGQEIYQARESCK